jgi:hypothetical protein
MVAKAIRAIESNKGWRVEEELSRSRSMKRGLIRPKGAEAVICPVVRVGGVGIPGRQLRQRVWSR